MKIAFVTDDGKYINPHFGRASHYLVIETHNGTIGEKLLLPKFLHHQEGPRHDEMSKEDKHAKMFASISGCDYLIANGMGLSAREAANSAGIKVINTSETNIEMALHLFLAGLLENNGRLVH